MEIYVVFTLKNGDTVTAFTDKYYHINLLSEHIADELENSQFVSIGNAGVSSEYVVSFEIKTF